MSKDRNKTLKALCQVGTVRGVCLCRNGQVIENRFPFSPARMRSLCDEVKITLDRFAEAERQVDRLVVGFDGGQLLVLVEGDLWLLLFHMIPDEADFVAKAGRAFLIDFGSELLEEEPEPVPVQENESPETDDVVLPIEAPAPAAEPAAEEEKPRVAARSTAPAKPKKTRRVVRESAPPAGDDLQQELFEDLDTVPAESEPEITQAPATVKELLAAARRSEGGSSAEHPLIVHRPQAVPAADAADKLDELPPLPAPEIPVEQELPAAVAPVAAAAASNGVVAHVQKQPAKTRPRPARNGGAAVVGAVVVQPARLAAHQPDSTLPPPKKPRLRRSDAYQS